MLNDLPTERVLPALKFCRVEANASIHDLAERTGYSTSAISRRLAGEVPLTLDELRRMAAAVGMDVTVTLAPSASREVAA